MNENKTTEIKVLPPRRMPPTTAQRAEAVALVAELLLDAVMKRRGLRSGGVIDGASDGVIGCVIPLPQRREKEREVA